MITPTLEREQALWAEGFRWVAGLDEVGRGPLAGPVVAAVVVLEPGMSEIEGLRDSKQLSVRQRDRVSEAIRSRARAWAVAAASVREIDRINILRATALAMRRAVDGLPHAPDKLLVDGSPLPELGATHEAIAHGDGVCQSIAAASVLAKCVRDRLMIRLGRRYPAFHWENNKGYGTVDHMSAIDSLGLTPHHRRSFTPVSQLSLFPRRAATPR